MTDKALPTPADSVTALAAPLAASLGLSIWGVEIAYGPRSIVRVYVDSEGGVDIDECAKLSRLLGISLEVEDIFPGAYVLEVSSPGLERVFFTESQLAAHAGQVVDVTLKSPSDAFLGRKKFRGVLELAGASHADAPLTDATHADATQADAEGSATAGQTFTLVVRDPTLPEEHDGILNFTFADIKRAKLVHIVPEKTLPGKGKKKSEA